jgi:hypothetical protein
MLRGCQKRVIHLKDTKSHLFDEAYFIVCEQNEEHPPLKERELICEARRIISEHLPQSELERKAKRKVLLLVGLSFLLGVMLSLFSMLLLW